jgi:peptidoglycan hydrolase-like protein with peptidoglycan-binding domain
MINFTKLSTGVLAAASVAAVFTFAVIVSAPKAEAYISPNILVGQDFTNGTTGDGVVILQGLLSEFGYLNIPAGVSFGYYGSLTKDAVARYQASLNVSPSVGYYGPITKQAMRSDFAPRGWLNVLGWN